MEKRIYTGQYIDDDFGIIYGGSIGEETIVIHTERQNRIGAGYGSSPDYVVTTVPLYYPASEDLTISVTRRGVMYNTFEIIIHVKQIDFINGSILVTVKKS